MSSPVPASYHQPTGYSQRRRLNTRYKVTDVTTINSRATG
jgi:hypothetical protein